MECPHCGDRVTWLDPPFFLEGRCVTCGEVSNFSVEPRLPRVRLVVRWQGGRPSPRELAALRKLLAHVRDKPLSDLARESHASAGFVLAVVPPDLAEERREAAERLGLVVESQQGSVAPLAMFGPLWYQTFKPAEAARSERLVHVWGADARLTRG